MKILFLTATLLIAGCSATPKEITMKSIYDIQVNRIGGETLNLSEYRGKVLLVVNTASKCGFTGQYSDLQKLYETYKDRGLVVLGFPSNDFLKQEPGSDEQIASFCQLNYGVSFPLFSKISVKGSKAHPLYQYLTSEESNPEFSGRITWNFNKFLISPEGQIVGRFGSRVNPSDKKIIAAIEEFL